MSLTRDQILAASDLEIEAVDCPEWGGVVYVRMLSLGERLAFEADAKHKAGPFGDRGVFLYLVAACLCDETGERIFSDDDVSLLTKKNADTVLRIATAAASLNRLTGDDVDELRKNSEASQDEDSRYDSRHVLA